MDQRLTSKSYNFKSCGKLQHKLEENRHKFNDFGLAMVFEIRHQCHKKNR